MPATKSRKASRQASLSKSARKPAAKKPAKAAREAVVVEHKSRNQIGREIQEVMSKSPLTIEQIATRCNVTPERVQAHYEYELSKNRVRLNSRKQIVVLNQPVRRAHA